MINDKSKIQIRTDYLLSTILRWGVLISMLVMLLGGALFFLSDEHLPTNYTTFEGEPVELKSIPRFFANALAGNSLAIMQMGILLLVATPVVRVIACVVLFSRQKDFLYVGIALFVLSILLYSLFLQPFI